MLGVRISQFGGQHVLRLAEMLVPEPGPGAVSIDVTYAGVTVDDVRHRTGSLPVGLPYVPGVEVTGHVRAVGAGVSGFVVGQPVVALTMATGGGYADVVVADASMVMPLPDDEGQSPFFAATPCDTTTAYLAADHIEPRESVLVHSAAGGVGAQVGQIARLGGEARLVVGTVDTPGKIPDAQAFGFDEVVTRDRLGAVTDALTPGGFDVVVDPVGGEVRTRSVGLLAAGGRLVAVDTCLESSDVLVSVDRLRTEGKTVIGHSTSMLARRAPTVVSGALRRAVTSVANGDVVVDVSDVLRLDQAGTAHARLEVEQSASKFVLAIHG